MGIIIDIIILIVMVLFILIGYKKGLLKVLINFIALVLSIILAIVLYRPVANFIINNTKIDDNINSGIYSKIENIDFENITDEQKKDNPILKFSGQYINKALDESKENVGKYVAENLTRTIIEGLSFIGLLIVLRLALLLLNLLSGIITNLPIIKQINKSGGIIYGLIEGLFIITIVIAILYIINPIVLDGKIEKSINKSKIGKIIYSHNIIINTLVK